MGWLDAGLMNIITLMFEIYHVYGSFIPFYKAIKSLLLGMKCVFQQQDLQMFGLKLNKHE